jgi:hypothetical protein
MGKILMGGAVSFERAFFFSFADRENVKLNASERQLDLRLNFGTESAKK